MNNKPLQGIRTVFEVAHRHYLFSTCTSLEVDEKYVAIFLPEGNRVIRKYEPVNHESPAAAMKFIRKMFAEWSQCPREANMDFPK